MARKPASSKADGNQALIRTGLFVLLAAALAAGCVVCVRQVWIAVSSRDEFNVRPGELAITSKWIFAEAMKRDFRRTDPTGILRCPGISIFASGLSEQVAQAYAASPWVRRVLSVTKEFPNRLDVQLELREPFALVQVGGRCYCVDDEGALLSPQFYDLTPQRLAALKPLITVAAAAPIPNAGRRWELPEVQEGLAMVRLCRRDLGGSVAVREVQVAAQSGAVMAWLLLDSGTRVEWGRTPSCARSTVEISPAQKTTALLALTRREGPQLGRFKTVDVRWPNPLCE